MEQEMSTLLPRYKQLVAILLKKTSFIAVFHCK